MSCDVIRKVYNEANKCVIDRDDEAWAILVSVVARTHCCLIGPPGTGKSFLIDTLGILTGATVFEYLMTEFSTPDEILGPISIDGLKATPSRYERNLTGMIADAELVFLDEVNKASGAIQNTLLKIMQERRIKNGTSVVPVQMRSMIGATNEDFEPGKQDAFADRWLVKMRVHPLPTGSWDQLLFGNLATPQPVATVQDLDNAHSGAMALQFSNDAKEAYKEVMLKLMAEGIRPSERRCREGTKVCRAEAYLNGASQVEPIHLDILKYVLFQHEKQRAKCEEIVTKTCNPAAAALQEYIQAVAEILDQSGDGEEGITNRLRKLDQIKNKVRSLQQSDKSHRLISQIDSEKMRLTNELYQVPPVPVG